jgi:hypothetical protein
MPCLLQTTLCFEQSARRLLIPPCNELIHGLCLLIRWCNKMVPVVCSLMQALH